MILIGITGAIGHGKTSLAEDFLELDTSAIHNESSLLITEIANLSKDSLPSTPDVRLINKWLMGLLPLIERSLGVKATQEELLLASESNLNSVDFEKLVQYITQRKSDLNFKSAKITPRNKNEHRAILQWIGGYFVNHIKRTIWYDELVRSASLAKEAGCNLYVIGGLRFPEDAETVRKAGGIIIGIQRPNITKIDEVDATERERLNITYDIEVINNGSLADLQHLARKILNDIKNNTFLAKYTSS